MSPAKRTGAHESARVQEDPFEKEHSPRDVDHAIRKALIALQTPLAPEEVNVILQRDGAALVIALTQLVISARAIDISSRDITCSRNAVSFNDTTQRNFCITVRIDEVPQTMNKILSLRRFRKREGVGNEDTFGKLSYPEAPQRVEEGEFCFIVQLDASGSVQSMKLGFHEYNEHGGIRLVLNSPSNPFSNIVVQEGIKAMRATIKEIRDRLAILKAARNR